MTSKHVIRCGAPDHASRRGQPGWSDALGSVELPPGAPPPRADGHLCEACGKAHREAAPRRVPPAVQLATLARIVQALVENQPVADDDRRLLRDLVD